MSQQIEGPARYQKPEESGMPHAQPTAQTMTALLRNAASVDAQKTKSLCCAAAGITALARSTTEVRTPHEKLRGAATPGATLNAQSGPLAQLVLGYRTRCSPLNFPAQSVDCHSDMMPTVIKPMYRRQGVISGQLPVTQHFACSLGGRDCAHKVTDINKLLVSYHVGADYVRYQRIKPLPLGHVTILAIPAGGFSCLQTKTLARLMTLKERTVCKTILNFRLKLINRLDVSEHGGKQKADLLRNQSSSSSNDRVSTSLNFCSIFFGVKNRKSSSANDSQNRPDSLRPVSSFLHQAKSIQQNKQCPSQRSYSQKCPDNPYAGDFHFWRHAEFLHASWLPAIKKRSACPFQSLPSMKEAA